MFIHLNYVLLKFLVYTSKTNDSVPIRYMYKNIEANVSRLNQFDFLKFNKTHIPIEATSLMIINVNVKQNVKHKLKAINVYFIYSEYIEHFIIELSQVHLFMKSFPNAAAAKKKEQKKGKKTRN